MAECKALIVEDSASFRELVKDILHSQFPSMEIIEAKNGKEGMEQAASFHPDLIFMDIRLPDESGLELTKKIKASWPDTTIIILTHYDFPEYREAASKQGANHFLAKGATTEEEILKLVQSILSERKIDKNDVTHKHLS